jgi:voltage-gated potassium channel
MGTEFFPRTGEGRVLCLFLAIYGFAVFGYVTATVATFFVGRDAANKASEVASQSSVEELRRELQLLREDLRTIER